MIKYQSLKHLINFRNIGKYEYKIFFTSGSAFLIVEFESRCYGFRGNFNRDRGKWLLVNKRKRAPRAWKAKKVDTEGKWQETKAQRESTTFVQINRQ